MRAKKSTTPDTAAPPTSPADAEITCVLDLTARLSMADDLEAGLEHVSDLLHGMVGYDTLAVLLLDEVHEELRIRYARGMPGEVVDHWRFGLGQGLVGLAAQTSTPVVTPDVGKEPRYIHAVDGLRSELAVPLVAKNRTVGVLDVGSRRPHHFTPQHQRLLTLLSGHLAHAIENARLQENMREQARTLSLLHELGRELASILEQEKLLQQVAAGIKRLIDYDLFAVMLWSPESESLRQAFSLRFDKRDSMRTELPLGTGICGTAAALRQTIRVPNVHLDPRYVSCNRDFDVRAELAVPLLLKDRLIGVIDLESVKPNAFTERHEQLLNTLASSIAIALENARLYDQRKEEENRLAQDLSTAREIQLQLLPKSRPLIQGLHTTAAYVPARHLGGDLYDFLPFGENRTLLAIGDVAGKATGAALYASLAVGMLRGHVMQHRCSPAQLLSHMNEELRQLHIDRRFVALTVALYDCGNRTLTVASAGLPPPRLVRRGRVEEIAVEGMPLGLLADVRYHQTTLTLQPDDVVVLHTDGVYECVDSQGEDFGLERLDHELRKVARQPVEEIAQGLIEATDRHIGSADPSDDRTLLVLKVTAGCIPAP